MTPAELQVVADRWHAFVDRFRVDGALSPMMQLKLEHSVRVSADALAIAEGEGWPDDEKQLAEAIGLLHDIARFPQFEQYQTFSDADSIDHGDLGFQTLEKENLLGELPAEIQSLILHAVQHHNKKDLPTAMAGAEEKYLRLIRDADWLDIFFVCWEVIASGKIHSQPEIMMNIDFNGPPTDVVVDQFHRGEAINYQNLNSMADRFILQLSWMHDLSYAASKRLVCDRSILDKFIDVLPVKTDSLLRCFEVTAKFLNT
ncbi:HD domain-containing protein [Tichowtungia aerotolerans]|uniref:HD domain-containing protein n=1 Tax=Tichowtungia aerotolerans TaxID=2697043 RepID=A0A6P1MBK0_9BACT|nr:HD domain-containing protein [Tichowtungia aerotolerans]QHI68946.1 HD domain-containing protein [Tichowtungia aerotolerans]